MVLTARLTILLAVIGLGSPQGARIAAQEANQNAGGNPATGFDLRRLERLQDAKLSPDEAAQIYLAFLREEVADPSPPRQGIGDGAITHDYILAQIVLAGAHGKVSQATLRRVAATAPPGGYRDAVLLTLGLMEDRSTVPFLIAYLADSRNPPFLRERAARALTRNPHPDAVPVLAVALRDPFWVPSGCIGPPMKHYRIRGEARLALRRIQEAGVSLPAEVQKRLAEAVLSEPLPSPAGGGGNQE